MVLAVYRMQQKCSKIVSVLSQLSVISIYTCRFFVPFASRTTVRNDRLVFSRYRSARYSNYAKLQRKRRIRKIAFPGIRRVTQSRLVTTYVQPPRATISSGQILFFFFTASQWRCANFAERNLSRPSFHSKKRSRIN